MSSYRSRPQDGFTLVELAIVLIVIGLIIGGILNGYEIVKSARLNRTYANVENYRSAVFSFKEKYGALPGDMRDASDRIVGCAASPSCLDAGGDGNGFIGTPRVANWSHDDQSGALSEPTQLWTHLFLGDFLVGMSGINNQAWNDLYPEAPIGGGFQVFHAYETGDNEASGHYFMLRAFATGDPHPDATTKGSIIPRDAAYLDQKFDDGIPNRGKIVADGDGALCWDVTTGEYNFLNGHESCISAYKF